jgi:hypothetical protein
MKEMRCLAYFIPGGKVVYPAFQRNCFYGTIYLSFKSSFISVLTSVGEMSIATGPHISGSVTCQSVSYGVKLTVFGCYQRRIGRYAANIR